MRKCGCGKGRTGLGAIRKSVTAKSVKELVGVSKDKYFYDAKKGELTIYGPRADHDFQYSVIRRNFEKKECDKYYRSCTYKVT